jgi:hypothetical protein
MLEGLGIAREKIFIHDGIGEADWEAWSIPIYWIRLGPCVVAEHNFHIAIYAPSKGAAYVCRRKLQRRGVANVWRIDVRIAPWAAQCGNEEENLARSFVGPSYAKIIYGAKG